MSLYIPEQIKVGFQERIDTFTGKLGFVVPIQNDGKVRQENSWNNWRNKNIQPETFENKPISGFVINKNVKRYGDWAATTEKVRVYDPRNFEFEITVGNLVNILMNSDISKRDIQQECIIAWKGAKIVLVPTNSVEYQELKGAKKLDEVKTKDLIPGATYRLQNREIIYLGKHSIPIEIGRDFQNNPIKMMENKHVIYDKAYDCFIVSQASKYLLVDSEPVSNYCYLVEKMYKKLGAKKQDFIISKQPYPKEPDPKIYFIKKIRGWGKSVIVSTGKHNTNSSDFSLKSISISKPEIKKDFFKMIEACYNPYGHHEIHETKREIDKLCENNQITYQKFLEIMKEMNMIPISLENKNQLIVR